MRKTTISFVPRSFRLFWFWAISLSMVTPAFGHVFDTDALVFHSLEPQTFSILDRSGCTAYTFIEITDPGVVSVSPMQTEPVVAQTYTVTPLKSGTARIIVSWQGNTDLCTEQSSHLIEVTVDSRELYLTGNTGEERTVLVTVPETGIYRITVEAELTGQPEQNLANNRIVYAVEVGERTRIGDWELY